MVSNEVLKINEAINLNKRKVHSASCWSCYTDLSVCRARRFIAFLKEEVQVYLNRRDVQKWRRIDVNLYSTKRMAQ
jgi:hypothetical protein